jgi:hypothetical protein
MEKLRETQRAYLRKGLMPKSVLGQNTRFVSKRELADILDQLIDSEVIGMTEGDVGGILYWGK